jgi:hypothetical protein
VTGFKFFNGNDVCIATYGYIQEGENSAAIGKDEKIIGFKCYTYSGDKGFREF